MFEASTWFFTLNRFLFTLWIKRLQLNVAIRFTQVKVLSQHLGTNQADLTKNDFVAMIWLNAISLCSVLTWSPAHLLSTGSCSQCWKRLRFQVFLQLFPFTFCISWLDVPLFRGFLEFSTPGIVSSLPEVHSLAQPCLISNTSQGGCLIYRDIPNDSAVSQLSLYG